MSVTHQIFSHIETDAACADDGDAGANWVSATQHVYVTQHFRMILSGNFRITRQHAGGDDDLVEVFQIAGLHALA